MKVIDRLLASNDQLRRLRGTSYTQSGSPGGSRVSHTKDDEQLRRQRDLAGDRVQQLSDERARLTSENRSLRCGEVLDRGSQTDRGEPVVA